MREKRYHIALDKYDKNIVINALNTLRTQQLKEERPTCLLYTSSDMQQEAIYFRGCYDSVGYLKKAGIL